MKENEKFLGKGTENPVGNKGLTTTPVQKTGKNGNPAIGDPIYFYLKQGKIYLSFSSNFLIDFNWTDAF